MNSFNLQENIYIKGFNFYDFFVVCQKKQPIP
jgi:hypothetical protein